MGLFAQGPDQGRPRGPVGHHEEGVAAHPAPRLPQGERDGGARVRGGGAHDDDGATIRARQAAQVPQGAGPREQP